MAPAPYVIVVSGLPRSGTSMMMRMLEAGGLTTLTDRVREADTDNPNGYYEFEAVKRTAQDTSWLEFAYGKVVKMVYRLLKDLPTDREYRVVFMRRAMQEVLDSQRTMLERSQRASNVSDTALAELFTRDLEAFDRWARAQSNFKVLKVDYNALLAECAPAIAEINDFLDNALDTHAMQQIIDHSLYRNRVA